MYTPPLFQEDRLPILHEAIRSARLATLVTLGGEGLEASHVPVLLEATEGPFGTLYGHFSRSNPQGQGSARDIQSLAIFMGPDAYVTPAWYATKQKTGKVVPTWNYVAVHAYGTLEVFDEADRLRRLVTRLTERHEAKRAQPWAVSDAPADYIATMLKGILGFRLPVDRLQGKWKMSQNRDAEDRAGVVAGLNAEGGPDEAAVAAIMAGDPER